VRYFEESDDPYLPGIPTEETFAEVTGRDVREVRKAVQNLRESYLMVQDGGMGDSMMILGVTDEARRAVGQWPSPEGIVDRLVQGLLDAAAREPDERKRSRLRAVAEVLGGFARDLAVGVLSNAAVVPLK
jgi:hypothetical protein